MAKIFIGMETSGQLRRRFAAQGHWVISCDILSCEDQATPFQLIHEATHPDILFEGCGAHLCGDVFETLDKLWSQGWWPDLAIFHPTCTYLTGSAEWAYKDPDYVRYPGVGYHQKLKPGTLFGAQRREAREDAMNQFRRIAHLPIRRKVVENPVGALTRIRKPSQIVQPYEFGDNASKKTCFWFFDKDANNLPDMCIPIDPAKRVPGRWVPRDLAMGKSDRENGNSGPPFLERWDNQTDTGQNRLSPGDDRWKDRSRTFPGVADAATAWWGALV